MIWRNRFGSPRTISGCSGDVTCSRTSFALAAVVTCATASPTTRRQRHRPHVDLEPAGQRLRHVQQIGRQLRLQPDVALDRLQPARLRRRVELAGPNQVEPAEHRVERRPQLVRDGSEELVLHPARRFEIAPRGLGEPGFELGAPPRVAQRRHQRRQQQALADEQREVRLHRGCRDVPRRGRPEDRAQHRDGQRAPGAGEPRGPEHADAEQTGKARRRRSPCRMNDRQERR